MKLIRYPGNPIIAPVASHPWESLVTANPAAWYEPEEDQFYLLYRASGSDAEFVVHFGLATSRDGFHFTRVSDAPIFSPSADGFDAGVVEDPRIVKFDGYYFITYASRPFPPGEYWIDPATRRHHPPLWPASFPKVLRGNQTTTGLLITKDFKQFIRAGRLTSPSVDDRDVILFPEKINGQFAMLHRPMEWAGPDYGTDHPAIWLKFSEDVLDWSGPSHLLARAEFPWECKIGGSTPPLRTDAGWLTLYHAVGPDRHYRIGAMLLDLENPLRVTHRLRDWLLQPEHDYELEGYYPGVVFPCGNVIKEGTLFVYYGGADKYVGLATCPVAELLNELLTSPYEAEDLNRNIPAEALRMTATSRELVLQTLNFERPARAPRHLWLSPWATKHYPEQVRHLVEDTQWDIGHADMRLKEKGIGQGDPWAIGTSTDDWGCEFKNVQEGVIGEVKHPMIEDWDDLARVRLPKEWLTVDTDAVNRDCDATDTYLLSGVCPRPFEQLQFLRGTENLYLDLLDMSVQLKDLLARMHAFYCDLLELWGKHTRVDALFIMDDWGSQNSLLIRPQIWREVFKPLYRDYAQIAHAHGKKLFMHSDGNITSIYPDLIEVGIDALNSQLFCMDFATLAQFAGQITFWGEIDRQHLLPHGTVEQINAAVRTVHQHLWRDGGCFAMCEFGPGARPENVFEVYRTWDELIQSNHSLNANGATHETLCQSTQ